MENKIEGLKIAQGKLVWVDGQKKSEAGYQFQKDGLTITIDQAKMTELSITMDAIMDCISQIEEMSEQDLKQSLGYRKNQGPMNYGLVLTSKIDPRVLMSATMGDANDNSDLVVSWFMVNPAQEPHEVSDSELKHVEQVRKETPEMKDDDIEKLLGLEVKAESASIIDTIKSHKEWSRDISFLIPPEDEVVVEAKTQKKRLKKQAEENIFEGVDGWGLPIVQEIAALKKKVKIAFQTVTPESSAMGDVSDHGWWEELEISADEHDRESGLSDADLAANAIKEHGAVEPSSTKYHQGVWYVTVDPERDGEEETTYSFHLNGFSSEEEKKIYSLITGKSEAVQEPAASQHRGKDERRSGKGLRGISKSGDSWRRAIRAKARGDVGLSDRLKQKAKDELKKDATVEEAIAEAFKSGVSKHVRNTRTDGKTVFLHENALIKRQGNKVLISGSALSNTAQGRINGVLETLGINAKVALKNGKPEINGNSWSGGWAEVGTLKPVSITQESIKTIRKKK